MVEGLLPLTLEGVTLRRRGRVILGPLDWCLDGRGVTIVMGPNGAGKTAFLRAMHGLERISTGRLFWAAQGALAWRAQAFVFQTPILMRRSVLDNIAYPLRLDGAGRSEARAKAAQMAEEVGLSLPADSLSAGERQKMALARALIRDPQVLFLDEPCANLDGASTIAIEAILFRARDRGTRIVMATHDTGQARRLADEVIFLRHGKMLDASLAEDFFGGGASSDAAAYMRGEVLV